MRIAISAAAVATLVACTSQPDYRAEDAPPPTVESVDLERYAGLWYEIARYPNSFETNCEGVTAEYALRDDGRVAVTNTCREGSVDGPERRSEGVARVVEGSGGSKLKVKFAPEWVPFASGDYWILHLEPDYSAAVIGAPSGKYLWVLSRTAKLKDDTLERLMMEARKRGFDTEPLRMVAQPPG